MRAVRFGSYSIVAILPGTPALSRLKSITRYFCLWPPPWCRTVTMPRKLRPARLRRSVNSGRCGALVVMSSVATETYPRRPAEVGLYSLMGMALHSLEQRDAIIARQRHERLLPRRLVGDAAAIAPRL